MKNTNTLENCQANKSIHFKMVTKTHKKKCAYNAQYNLMKQIGNLTKVIKGELPCKSL